MTQKLHDKIRSVIENTPGLTQRGLAQSMGLNPAAVNRMLYGQRNIMAEEIPVIERYIGVKLGVGAHDVEYPERGGAGQKGFSDASAAALDGHGTLVPVFGPTLTADKPVDWVARHPAQNGARDAIGWYTPDDDMEPRYFRGELVYLHPHRPPQPGRDFVFVMKNGDVRLRRILSAARGVFRVLQFAPNKESDIAEKDVSAVYAVVGRS